MNNKEIFSIATGVEQISEKTPDVSEKFNKLQKRFWKNVIIISLAFLLVFMGYHPMSSVQSSLNSEKGLGVTTLSIKFAAMVLGGICTNNYLVNRLGCKWTIAAGMFTYAAFIAGNFYPALFTLGPLGVLAGFGGAAMWIAQGSYLTRISNEYVAVSSHVTSDGTAAAQAHMKSRVFGIFYSLYFASGALGNVASSLILVPNTQRINNERLEHCGVEYCNEDLNSFSATRNGILVKPDRGPTYALCTFCFTSALCGALLVTMFVDRLPSLGVCEKATGSHSTSKLIMATIRQWKHPYQLLLIPLEMYNGMEAVFFGAEFTKAFVTCPLGVHYVGYVMVCSGLSTGVCNLLYNCLLKPKYRFVPFIIGIVSQITIMVVIMKWTPRGVADLPILYAIAVMWGIGVGAFGPCTYVFISIVFQENMEAAFSNYYVWNNLAQSISYAWSYNLCVYIKVYLMMGVVLIAVICYLSIELHLFVFSKKTTLPEVRPEETLNASIEHRRGRLDSTAPIYGSIAIPVLKVNSN